MSNDLRATTRKYLAEIYRLSEHAPGVRGYVSTSALADALGVSAPAVNRMVTKLKEMDLLLHEPYQGISLTPSGRREALVILRRHRIAEAFLVRVMGFGWHEVHEEANRISAALSDMLAERMLEMAGHPTHCPHGEVIPSGAGDLERLNDIRLADARPDTAYAITRVLTREPDRLEYMAALGLLPGTHLKVLHMAPFNGPMQLRVKEEYRIIGHNLAELIKVTPE